MERVFIAACPVRDMMFVATNKLKASVLLRTGCFKKRRDKQQPGKHQHPVPTGLKMGVFGCYKHIVLTGLEH